jgi:AcrR family transcriptional regulator
MDGAAPRPPDATAVAPRTARAVAVTEKSRTPRAPAGTVRPSRSGRRPGNPDTRQAILEAARVTFAELGFAGASMRRIASAAGVDAALVHHYFGSKEKLFLATVEVPVDLPRIIAGISAEGIDGLGVKLITTMLGVWESPAGAGLAAALRSALADPQRARMFREFVVPQLVGPLLRPLSIPPEELDLRIGLLMSQMFGVISARYLLVIEPIASLPADVLAANVGATIQRYLVGPLIPGSTMNPAGI